MLIDTGWNDAQTEDILDEWRRLRMPAVTKALVTHWHYDRLGGIGALTKRYIPAFGNPLTIGLALDNGHAPPLPLHDVEKHAQQLSAVEVFYPGAGHTIDNIVAWIPRDRVLFGGCLIKSTTAPDLGYLADANVAAWPAAMRMLERRYRPRHTISGHGTISGNSIAHTTALAEALKRASR